MVSALDGLASFKGDNGKTVKGDNIFTYWYPSAVAKRAKGTTAAADKEAEKAAELAAEIAIAKERAASALKIAQGIESDAGELLLKIQSTYNHAKHYLGDGASANVQKGMAKKYDALEKKAEKSVRRGQKARREGRRPERGVPYQRGTLALTRGQDRQSSCCWPQARDRAGARAEGR